MNKFYLGDGAYIETNGYGWVLTTEDGVRITNRIVLEPPEMGRLIEYVNKSTQGTIG